ncbi:MAG: Uma2 family endonuclease [Gemmatimonadetes bacterium]|nr:Uma2 family endonuclease [Gemmatimonadota bacterium]
MVMPLTRHRFTVDEYQRMGAAGVFREDDRVELIDGQVVQMTPIGPEHGGCVKDLARLFYLAAGDQVILGIQDPLVLGPYAAPQPDIAVLRPRREGYRTAHPGPADVLLVIEVADTSVRYDRQTKIPLYAAAGIPEAWLVDLPARRIRVYREPGPDGYNSVRTFGPGDTLTPLHLPTVTLRVNDILG